MQILHDIPRCRSLGLSKISEIVGSGRREDDQIAGRDEVVIVGLDQKRALGQLNLHIKMEGTMALRLARLKSVRVLDSAGAKLVSQASFGNPILGKYTCKMLGGKEQTGSPT